uniref:Uncharacterized protein n=1 Tax=Anopheles minimus TaxID=112268 RepID=A0A182VY67_9DIPT
MLNLFILLTECLFLHFARFIIFNRNEVNLFFKHELFCCAMNYFPNKITTNPFTYPYLFSDKFAYSIASKQTLGCPVCFSFWRFNNDFKFLVLNTITLYPFILQFFHISLFLSFFFHDFILRICNVLLCKMQIGNSCERKLGTPAPIPSWDNVTGCEYETQHN